MRGTFLNLGSPLVAEVCALSGFDWLLVDLEHGFRGEDALIGQLLAGEAHDVPMLVRTEAAERIRVGHVLDLGAAGVMFPRLDTPEEVAEAVTHLHYPPHGNRGVATYNRARRFGGDTRDAKAVGEEILCVVQIESLSALENVEDIAATSGVDVLFVGPGDLSTALGIPGQLSSREFTSALERVSSAARGANIAAGILTPDLERVKSLNEQGYSFISVASDSAILRSAARLASGQES
jgi:2-dehydro-3-deoxyglucarate aldolase/4-hydroxy-2-oxoheptanedioate aldolase